MNNAFIKKMNNLYIFYWLRKSICNIKWSALREMRDLPGKQMSIGKGRSVRAITCDYEAQLLDDGRIC